MGGDVPFTHYAEVNPKRGLRRGDVYPFVEMASLPEGGGELRYLGERVFEGQGSRFGVGDTLFARITPCTENGKASIIRHLDGHNVGFGSTEFIVLAARNGASPEFIYQLATSPEVRARAIGRMLGTSGRQRVPTWFFEEELTLPLFTEPEQRAIGDVLHAIDEAIEKTEAVIAATEDLRKALLQELLTRGVPGWHTEWKTVPGIGAIPACWEVARLGEVAKFTSGLLKRTTELQDCSAAFPVPVYGGNGISGYTDRPLLSNRAVVIGRVGQKCGSVHTTADAAWITDNALYSQWTRPGTAIEFLGLILAAAGLNEIRNRNDLPLLTQAIVHGISVALPCEQEQRKIVAIVESAGNQTSAEEQTLSQLRTLKAAAAEALLSGRVRVSLEGEADQ